MCQCIVECALLTGTRSAEGIMASGHVNRTNRPNTWLHRPACKREEKPCQLGGRIEMSQCSSLSRTGFPLPIRVKWRRDHLGVGHHLMQQSEPLRLGRERQQTDAGGVAAGPVETGDEVELNRVWRWYVAQRMRGGLSGYSSSAGSPPSLRRSLRARRRSDMPKPSAVRAPLGPGSFPGAAPGDRPHACGFKLANDGHDTRALQHYLASWSLPIPSAMRASFYCPSSTRASAGRACVGPTRSDPDTTVLIPPIAFEPFDRPRRLIIGNHPPAIEPERGMVEAGVSERNRGVTRSARAG